MKKITTVLAAAAGLLFVTSVHAAENPALMQPVKSVYDHYLVIQKDLAGDSLQGVDKEADTIVKAVNGDSMKMLPKDVATEAGALAKANDLTTARAAFKTLSASLIKYLADHNAKAAYVEVHCPMAKASWLQSDKTVKNPYLGKSMSSCGMIQE